MREGGRYPVRSETLGCVESLRVRPNRPREVRHLPSPIRMIHSRRHPARALFVKRVFRRVIFEGKESGRSITLYPMIEFIPSRVCPDPLNLLPFAVFVLVALLLITFLPRTFLQPQLMRQPSPWDILYWHARRNWNLLRVAQNRLFQMV